MARFVVTASLILLAGGSNLFGLQLTACARAPESSTQSVTFSGQRHASDNVSHAVTSVRVFLVAVGDNGKSGKKIGCGDSLVAITRPIAPTRAPLSAAFWLLLADHRRLYGQTGLYDALYQSRLRLQRATVVHGRATVHLAGTMQLGGECDNPRVGAQLRQTALQFRTVHNVRIYVNGIPLARWLSEKG